MNNTFDSINALEQSVKVSDQMNNVYLESKAWGNFGVALNYFHYYERALLAIEKAIKFAQEINAQDVYARALWSKGMNYFFTARYNEAIVLLSRATGLFYDLGMSEYAEAIQFVKEFTTE
jgi:tetratricopeptide (TPR) repeat protein